ncbi:hypothetical protein O9992_02580 [Vibrio lentus]|nr:hypothetical protein [Vibrio lentus]
MTIQEGNILANDTALHVQKAVEDLWFESLKAIEAISDMNSQIAFEPLKSSNPFPVK